jgi:trimeric autotransporter adhesin
MGRRSAVAAAAAAAAGIALGAAPAAAQQAWSAVGTGLDGPVYALANYGGEVVAAGAFADAGGVTALNIAVFTNASGWAPLGLGLAGEVYALAQDAGSLYVGGAFYSSGGDADAGDAVVAMANVGRWTGTEWQPLGAGVNGFVYALAADGAGHVYIGGDFTALNDEDATPVSRVAVWDGSAYADLLGGVDGPVYAFALLNGAVYMGGLFGAAGADGAVAVSNVAQWVPEDSAWADVAGGFDGSVSSLLAVGGTLYAAGSFQYAGGGPEPAGMNYIAAIDPAAATPAWAPVGGAFDALTSTAVAPSVGDIVSLSSVSGSLV